MLRIGYHAALNGEKDMHGNPTHLKHCFDYLRQGIMCAGDTTLEWSARASNGTKLNGVDGWGITHECVNYELLKEWTDRNRGSDGFGIV